jgi:hypothetical protein
MKMSRKNLSGQPVTVLTVTIQGDVGGLSLDRSFPGSVVTLAMDGLTVLSVQGDIKGDTTDVVEVSLACVSANFSVVSSPEINESPALLSVEPT